MKILHKAKRISFNNNIHGKWVEGYYIYHIKRTPCVIGDCVKPEDEVHMIAYDGFSDWNMPRDVERCLIDPETLCRYTGLEDRYKQKLWEHDIVTIAGEDGYFHLCWEEDRAAYVLENDLENFVVTFDNYWAHEMERHGNIFDNPELMQTEYEG